MNVSIIPHADPDDNQLFTYYFEGCPIRGIMRDSEPLFVAADVCAAGGISNASMAVARLDTDEKDDIRLADTIGRMQYISVVTESGLYNLILRSDKPQAKAFKRYVTHELLPAIRKGTLIVPRPAPLSPLDVLDNMVQQLRAQEAKINQIEAVAADTAVGLQDVKARLDNADYLTVVQFCKVQGIRCTPSLAIMWGKRAATLSRERGAEILRTVVDGPIGAINRYHKDVLILACVPKPKPGQLPLIGGAR